MLCVQTFQKLIFVSNLVFTEQKAAFLLPWKRIFGITDSQLYVARRDNAKNLFKAFLDEQGGTLEVHVLYYAFNLIHPSRADVMLVLHSCPCPLSSWSCWIGR